MEKKTIQKTGLQTEDHCHSSLHYSTESKAIDIQGGGHLGSASTIFTP